MATSKIKVEKYQELKAGTDYTVTFNETNVDMTKTHSANLYQVTENLFYLKIGATLKVEVNSHALKTFADLSITGRTIAAAVNGMVGVYGGYANYLLAQSSMTDAGSIRFMNPSETKYSTNLSFTAYLWFLAY